MDRYDSVLWTNGGWHPLHRMFLGEFGKPRYSRIKFLHLKIQLESTTPAAAVEVYTRLYNAGQDCGMLLRQLEDLDSREQDVCLQAVSPER